LSDRPWKALVLSAILSVTSMWAGLTLSYAVPRVPASFAILSFASGVYLLSGLRSRISRERLSLQGWKPGMR
jgi:zinc/manganese transport system permease protein